MAGTNLRVMTFNLLTSTKKRRSHPWRLRKRNIARIFNELKPDVWPRESSGPVVRIAEIFQRVADLAELENPDVTTADYSGTWTRVGPWLPWMRQGQAEGNLVFSTFMTKLKSIDELPPRFKARIEEAGFQWSPPSPIKYVAKDW